MLIKLMKTTTEIITIAGTGVNLIIDVQKKTTTEIISIVGSVGRKDGHVTIINCNRKTITELLTICSIYPKNITLDLTDRK